jgi:diaminopimelate decarboxylase
LARRGGVAKERIVFAGPGKGRDELELVVNEGIGEIHVEGFDEIQLLEEVASWAGKEVSVSVRINPRAAFGGGLMMGGQPTAFGFEEESMDQALHAISQCRHLQFRGVHLYTGTQILDAEVLLRHWEHALDVASHAAEVTGTPVATIDLGGGLGIPYFAHEKELDLSALGRGADILVSKAQGDPRLSQARFLIEPGRFLAGPAGMYVARVRSVKSCRGTTFVVLDGGMNHHLAASCNLGQVVRRDYPIMNLSRQGSDVESPLVIVGPLCTPIDTLGRKVKIPLPKHGDLIGILQSGAYGMTSSPTQFLSHPSPAEVLVGEGRQELITSRRLSFETPVDCRNGVIVSSNRTEVVTRE